MRPAILIIAAALLAVGCAQQQSMAVMEEAAPAPLACEPYDGAEAVIALARSHIIILGEAIHGTEESPAALYELACGLVEKGVPLRVGFEATYTQTDALKAFLKAPDNLEALRKDAESMWSVHDGRSSEAILLLLQKLAALRTKGVDVSVFAFDAGEGEAAGADSSFNARDAAMARHVDEAVNGYEGAVLLLTGGWHARETAFDYEDIEYIPMASRITARPVLSLAMHHAGGSGWMWGEIDGEPFKGVMKLNNLLPEGTPERAFLLEPTRTGTDGIYYTGPITASPPAFPAAPTP